MYLEILAIVILLAGALLHYKAGVWAAVMSLWMIIVSGAVAVGFYLPVRNLLPWGKSPVTMGYYWLDGLVLILMFVIVLAMLRILGVKTLRQRMKLSALIDTIGGAVVGAVAGYFAAGVIALFAQMMPTPPAVLGYQPFDLVSGQRQQRLSLRYDDAVLGLFSGLSRGTLSSDEAGLPGRFPNRFPAQALQSRDSARPYRARNHEDILYEYFRRRVDLALMHQKDTEPMTTDEQAGVALVSGQSKTLKADRNAQPLWVQVNDAWVVPALITPQFDGASGAVALEPADLNWVDVEGEVQGSSDHALLMVEVSFRPGESNAAMLVQLDEWRLSSNLATPPAGARGSARMFFDHPRPKFIGLAKWNATDNVLEAPQSDLLQLETVNYTMPAAEARAQLRDQQQAFFVADEAVWKFEDTGKTARATLVFMVPALSRPWNYALRYGSGGGSASSGTGAGGGAGGGSVGLYRNVVTDLSPLKLTVNNVTRTLRIEGLTLDPLPVGQSYITVDLRVEHHGDHPILLRAEDLLLSYKQGEGQRGMLLEKLSAPRKGVPLKGDTRVLNTSVNAGENPFLTVNEDETAGLRLAPQWSSYMRLKSNSTLRLVYVFPAVAAFGDFEFVLAGTLTEEPPEWFLMQESKKASHSVTHGISLGDVRTSLAESFILENGRTRTQRLEVGAQEYLIIPLKIRPLKSDDKDYYYVEPAEAMVRLSESGRWVDIRPSGVRLAGAETFQRDLTQRVIINGEQTVEFVYIVAVQRGDVSINAVGRQMPVSK